MYKYTVILLRACLCFLGGPVRIAECGAGCQQLISDLVACSRGGWMHAPRCHRSPHGGGNQLFPPRDLEQGCHEDQLVGKMLSSPGQAEGWMDAGVCSGRAMKAGTLAWVWRTFPGLMLQHKQCGSSRAHSTIHTAQGPHFVTRTAAEARRDGRGLGLIQETWKEVWTSPR